jgi:hypothetical protein
MEDAQHDDCDFLMAKIKKASDDDDVDFSLIYL